VRVWDGEADVVGGSAAKSEVVAGAERARTRIGKTCNSCGLECEA
jgi:hypothetical protein